MKIRYTRVSRHGQSFDIQLAKLKNAGYEKIFSEKVNVAKEQRKEFNTMLNFAREGHPVVVTRLDRLNCSLIGLQNTPTEFDNKKINSEVLKQQIDNTARGRLMFNIEEIIGIHNLQLIGKSKAKVVFEYFKDK